MATAAPLTRIATPETDEAANCGGLPDGNARVSNLER
jgi:hypothetical protein